MQENLIYCSAENVANFYQKHGAQIIRTESCWWFNEYQQKFVFYSFPPHGQIVPTQEEEKELFDQLPYVIALRFLGPFKGSGKPSSIWICQKPYDLHTLEKKSRNQTRRGLEHCIVRQITFSELVEKGWPAHSDTNKRHNQKAQSLGFDMTLDECDAYKAWGAFVNDLLIAYVVVLLVDDWAHIIINRSANSSLKYYPNNALVFKVVSDILSLEQINTVSYGWDSLVPNLGLEKFKLGMGFHKESVRQRIVIRPSLRFLINKHSCSLIVKILSPFPLNYRFQQFVGLCRIVTES